MERNTADDWMYVRHKQGLLVILALYVDYLLIACSHDIKLKQTKLELCTGFKMKDFGESHFILGMDISHDRNSRPRNVCQSRYAQKVIERFGLQSANGSATAIETGLDLTMSDDVSDHRYRSAIGDLMYLMVGNRPDLAFTVCTLDKYVDRHANFHWCSMERLLCDVIHTKHLRLRYGGMGADLTPLVCVDMDRARDHAGRKNMSGCVVVMGCAAVFR